MHVRFILAPQGSVRDLIVSDVWPKSVFLSWKPVVCSLRGGNLLHYDVKLQQLDGVEDAVVTSTNSTLATVLYLSPSTHYNASVRYVNSAGAGPYNDVVVFLTPPDGEWVSLVQDLFILPIKFLVINFVSTFVHIV